MIPAADDARPERPYGRPMLSLTRPARIAAATGGLLWTAKAAIITARDGSFDPLESVMFLGGLAALLAAAVLVAHALTRGLSGAGRVAATVAGAIGLVALTVAIEQAGNSVVGGAYDGGNLGVEDESGILLAGLFWLAVGVASALRARRPAGSRSAAVPAPR